MLIGPIRLRSGQGQFVVKPVFFGVFAFVGRLLIEASWGGVGDKAGGALVFAGAADVAEVGAGFLG